MKPEYEIVCVQKDKNFILRCFLKPSIAEIGYKLETGETVVISQQKAVHMIKNNICNFYVRTRKSKVSVSVRIREKNKECLVSESEGVVTKDIYKLPKCTTNRG